MQLLGLFSVVDLSTSGTIVRIWSSRTVCVHGNEEDAPHCNSVVHRCVLIVCGQQNVYQDFTHTHAHTHTLVDTVSAGFGRFKGFDDSKKIMKNHQAYM